MRDEETILLVMVWKCQNGQKVLLRHCCISERSTFTENCNRRNNRL